MGLLNEPLRFPAPAQTATVTLVGAGPGDPELLTVKALKALQAADVVLYDNLVGKEILELLPHGADRIYVGKKAGHHALAQEAIIELMVRLAKGGRPVLRLKGGDPYTFGRGGEEVEALAAAGVPFVVVPGISAAQAAGAAAGIPLTHRDHASTLVFATGHLRDHDGERSVDLDWPALARPHQTVVIYMGVAALPVVCAQLVAHGMSPDTPAAVVERASQADERTIAGTLRTLPSLALLHRVGTPALIMIGGVVALRARLAAAGTKAAARDGRLQLVAASRAEPFRPSERSASPLPA